MEIESAATASAEPTQQFFESETKFSHRASAEVASDSDKESEVRASQPNPFLSIVRRGEARIKSNMNRDEFDRFVLENSDLRIERDKSGTIIIHPPMTLNSGFFEEEVLYFLKDWSRRFPKLGKVYSPSTSFNLPDGSQHKADGAWISTEKLNSLSPEQRKTIAPIVPDFVIETRSQTDKLANLKKKMQQVWLANGVQLAWLIDPQQEKVWIYRAGQTMPEEVSNFSARLSGESVLPDFELDLAALHRADEE